MAEFDSCDLASAAVALDFAARVVQVEPDEAWVRRCVDENLFSASPFGENDDAVKKGLSLMDSGCKVFMGDSRESLAAIRREWLRLFVGLGSPDASLSESFYVDPNGALFSGNTLKVRAAYQAWGLENSRRAHEPDDMLGMMLAFCAYLARTAAEASRSGNETLRVCALDFFERFLVEHMLPWASAWRFLVAKHASSDYYRGVGEFVFGLERACAARFGIGFDKMDGVFAYRRP